MSWSESIRRAARQKRIALGFPEREIAASGKILDAAQRDARLTVYLLAAADPLLNGAQVLLDPSESAINVSTSLSLSLATLAIAHEIGHFWLHHSLSLCAADDLAQDGFVIASDIQSVDGFSPQQRRESEANIFAAELLLPAGLATSLFYDKGMSASEIAARVGLPLPLVMTQLAESALLPASGEEPKKPDVHSSWSLDSLDDSQHLAATAIPGPVLIGAGPGTGKTRTLVGRCVYLTEELGVPPAQILALTYSRKAAQEMRERITAALPVDTHGAPWIGTFHSFALEVLRRFGARLGMPADLKLFDTLDCVTLLENNLSRLKLSALDNIFNPSVSLPGIVRQISRAKDELCTPEQYADLCAAMDRDASRAERELKARTDKVLKKEIEAVEKLRSDADKASEVARCYPVYEQLLHEHSGVDYSGLIAQTVRLLEEHPEVAETLRLEYPHVLADEYQDVNRATARMLQLLAGPAGKGLWVVGDHRQSIYRFRGASPANIVAFARDYPTGKRIDLDVNYRSHTSIVEMFDAFSRICAFDGDDHGSGSRWNAQRGGAGDTPCVRLSVADCDSSQESCIADIIAEMTSETGRSYRDIAVLTRTHGQAQSIANALAAQGIPALYVGDILDREEVRDLLCLMAVAAGEPVPALARAGALPEYGLSQEQISSLIEQIAASDEATNAEKVTAALSALGSEGATRLAKQIDRLQTYLDSPRRMLEAMLFDVTGLLRSSALESANEYALLQMRLVLHQLLSIAAAFEIKTIVPKKRRANRALDFLDYLRRMRIAGDSPRGSIPDSMAGTDAVRIMTVHAAKGLEFPVVFLPYLGKGQFPARGRSDGLPEPPGLADCEGDEISEEECLFFVALSRARDELIVSYGTSSESGKPMEISPLLAKLQPWLAQKGIERGEWSKPAGSEQPLPDDLPGGELPTYSAAALEIYMVCPRRYYYEHVRGLPGETEKSGYQAFHYCLRDGLRWMHEKWHDGLSPTFEEIGAHFDATWKLHGPVGQDCEERYRAEALAMLRRAHEAGPQEKRLSGIASLEAPLQECKVRVRPDETFETDSDGSLVLVRYRTGNPGDDHTEPRLSLLRHAAESHGVPHRIEIHYLATGEVKLVEPNPRYEPARIAKFDQAAAGILRGEFSPRPGDICKSCPYALICPK